MYPKCPYCKNELPISMSAEWEWICPECGHKNNVHPGWYSCEKCRFGPKFAACPHCKKSIELMTLFFG